MSDTKKLVMLLDYDARSDLRQCCQKGYINRSLYKRRGVRLLEILKLITNVKTHKTMYRYEPTELGYEVSKLLPDRESEWNYTMHHKPLIYGDGSIVEYGKTPHYSTIRDYEKLRRELRRELR